MYWADVYFHGNTVFVTANFGMLVKEVGNDKFCILLSTLGLGHHHLAELIKVHRARTILIKLLEDALVDVLFTV